MAQLIEPHIFKDGRGTLTKFKAEFSVKEIYYSTSKKGVLRGMHFQNGAAKLIYVSKGKVLDVVLNLKTGQWLSFELKNKALFIPDGWAHGFLALTDCCMHYLQSEVYAPNKEGGVFYNSFGFRWPINKPKLSKRDENFRRYVDL